MVHSKTGKLKWKSVASRKLLTKNQKLSLLQFVACMVSGARMSIVSCLHYNFTCFLSQTYMS